MRAAVAQLALIAPPLIGDASVIDLNALRAILALANLAGPLEVGDHLVGQRLGVFRAGVQDQFRLERALRRGRRCP